MKFMTAASVKNLPGYIEQNRRNSEMAYKREQDTEEKEKQRFVADLGYDIFKAVESVPPEYRTDPDVMKKATSVVIEKAKSDPRFSKEAFISAIQIVKGFTQEAQQSQAYKRAEQDRITSQNDENAMGTLLRNKYLSGSNVPKDDYDIDSPRGNGAAESDMTRSMSGKGIMAYIDEINNAKAREQKNELFDLNKKRTNIDIKNAQDQQSLFGYQKEGLERQKKNQIEADKAQEIIDKISAMNSQGKGSDYRGLLAGQPEGVQRQVNEYLSSKAKGNTKAYLEEEKERSLIAKNTAEAFAKLNPEDKTFSKFKKAGDLYSLQADNILKKYKGQIGEDGEETPEEIALRTLAASPNAPQYAIDDWDKYKTLTDKATSSYNKANGSIVGGSPVASTDGVDLTGFDSGVSDKSKTNNDTTDTKITNNVPDDKQPITQMSKDEIKNIYRFSNLKGSDYPTTTPLTMIQKVASKAQNQKYEKFGEGEIEKALRDAGISDKLQEQKTIAKALKSKFRDATIEQIVTMIKQSAKAGL